MLLTLSFRSLLNLSIRHRFKAIVCSLLITRLKSQSTSLPKRQLRVRDHAYDDYMEVEKKVRKTLKFHSLILSQFNQTLPVSRLDALSRRLGFRKDEACSFVLKFPHVFEIYEHPVQRILFCRLTRKALLQIQEEQKAMASQIPDAVIRLRKMLMMSNTGRIRAEHIRIARAEFGLPDDFLESVVLKNPQYFRLADAKEYRHKYIEIVERDPSLAVCAIEKVREQEYREKGLDAEDMRFAFTVNFPPGFKIGKYYRIAVWKWQRTPYWSPYEDISGYDIRSIEAQKRLEKRAVAVIHELLSLTVEKKITLERIAHFRMIFDLPKKLKEFLLQHQGIFYISTRGNYGKLHTVFLREAYKKGDLVEPNLLYLARRRLSELLLLSPRRAPLDVGLIDDRITRTDDGVERFRREFADNAFPSRRNRRAYDESSIRFENSRDQTETQLLDDLGMDLDIESDSTDEHSTDADGAETSNDDI